MKYLTMHTWAKTTRRELNVSEWYNEHVILLLQAKVPMPKRFMIYCQSQHPQIWHRIRHDYSDMVDLSVAAMEARAAYAYAKSLHVMVNK